MSASARDGRPMTQTFDTEEIPPPMPLSCRPCGSGEPIAAQKIASQRAWSAGRSVALNIRPLLVPPRMKTAGMVRELMPEVCPLDLHHARPRTGSLFRRAGFDDLPGVGARSLSHSGNCRLRLRATPRG